MQQPKSENMTHQDIQEENETITEVEALAKITTENPQIIGTPSKAEIILKIIEERTKLEQYREDLLTGKRRPSNLMKAVFYVSQIILSANKVILDAMKENIQINTGHVDITTEINELIKISREPECNNSAESQP